MATVESLVQLILFHICGHFICEGQPYLSYRGSYYVRNQKERTRGLVGQPNTRSTEVHMMSRESYSIELHRKRACLDVTTEKCAHNL